MATLTQVSRDPFARTTLMRQSISHSGITASMKCAWCGNLNRYGGLFMYGTEPDGVSTRINWHKGLFCSKGCHDCYHG